jgi:hypothetical protein
MDALDQAAPPGVSVAAKAGDVTLHFSDVMHAAPPPMAESGPYRSSILLNFDREFKHHRGDRHYNDVLMDEGTGQVDHLQKKMTRL